MSERNMWIPIEIFGYIIAIGTCILIGIVTKNPLITLLGLGLIGGISIMVDARIERLKIDLKNKSTNPNRNSENK